MSREEEYKGFTIVTELDPAPVNPRWGTNLGWLISANKHVDGDYHTHDVEEAIEQWLDGLSKDQAIVLPVYCYVHGGVALSTTPWPYSLHWDSGLAGVIMVTYPYLREWYDWKRITVQRRAWVVELLKAEIKEYSEFLQGLVFQFLVLDADGNLYEKEGDWYSEESALKEARAVVDRIIEREASHG